MGFLRCTRCTWCKYNCTCVVWMYVSVHLYAAKRVCVCVWFCVCMCICICQQVLANSCTHNFLHSYSVTFFLPYFFSLTFLLCSVLGSFLFFSLSCFLPSFFFNILAGRVGSQFNRSGVVSNSTYNIRYVSSNSYLHENIECVWWEERKTCR